MIREFWNHVWYTWEEPHRKTFSKAFYIGTDPPYHRGNGYRISFRTSSLAFGYCRDHPESSILEQLDGRPITEEEWAEMKERFAGVDQT